MVTSLDIVVVGAGRHGRNLIGMIEEAGGYRIRAVLDDAVSDADVLGHRRLQLGSYAGPDWNAVLAIGSGSTRRAIVERARRFHWQRFVHPATHLSRHAELGEGCTVLPFASVSACRLGAHVAVLPSCVVGSGVEIGEFSSLMPHVLVGSDAHIGRDCMICAGARVLAGVSIGDRCVVGPNAVIGRDLLPDSLAVARSAEIRVLRRASPEDAMAELQDAS
jgi:sugar O-acyltransferase (sialic acid O-acetyltransferase NeuD family)